MKLRPRFMAITDRRQMGPDPDAKIEALAKVLGPALVLQLREKDLPARALYEWARALEPRLAAHGALLLINERVDIAACLDGAGVHLPELGLDPAEARRLLGPDRPIGASAHDLEGLQKKASAGANLITLSPIFASPQKGAPLGLVPLKQAGQQVRSAELFALGGVDAERIPLVRALGAHPAAIRAAWQSQPQALAAQLFAQS